ncbi:type IV toxin-antitoxin system AbiEi family antitoxin domain-containing protein [Flexivirga meconopsidis]|uniref:type IV toxin-antitoxin system AbiEi family antitoxin domain-containing protein n=1 Tax=Flexivirga meconopsidis TaxID=2977121 RepID=UPI00223F4969|nr:type IV toxin-antitoxin system AbiEi family antitoxin domain-containing protein [Flexivirga meconopsidis]
MSTASRKISLAAQDHWLGIVARTALRARLTTLGGIITARDLRAIGISSRDTARLVREGSLRRVQRGAYVEGSLLDAAGLDERRLLEARACVRSLMTDPPSVVAGQQTALAIHRLPVWPVDRTTHVVRVGAGRSHGWSGVRVHRSFGPSSWAMYDGVPALDPAFAVVSTAVWHGTESGLVACDAALHQQLVGFAELRRIVDANPKRPGINHARRMLELTDPAAESPGETRTRLVLLGMGLRFVSQPGIPTRIGQFFPDFALPDVGILIEFDGAVKYRKDGSTAVVDEKAREDALREQGWLVIRVIWSDLADPERLSRRIREAIRQRRSWAQMPA